MTTSIEDKELNAEVKELHLIANHWMSELDSFEKDILAIKENAMRPEKNQEGVLEQIAETLETVVKLKDLLSCYLKSLEPLTRFKFKIPLRMIETHVTLDREINSLLKVLISLKERLAIYS